MKEMRAGVPSGSVVFVNYPDEKTLEIEYPYRRHVFLISPSGEIIKKTVKSSTEEEEVLVKDAVLAERIKKLLSEPQSDVVKLFYEIVDLIYERELELRDELELAIREVVKRFYELNAEVRKLKRVRNIRNKRDFVYLLRDAIDIMYDC